MARKRQSDSSGGDGRTRDRVSIRPGVTVLSVLRHLNYKPWFALAEFVDNAVQSFLDRREALSQIEGPDFKLTVEIEIDPTDGGTIAIRDNAAGIHEEDYPRAFRPAELPPDQSGLCEFGMGMKSAACWFSPTWSVRTSALGETTEKTVVFDISRIVRDRIEELDVEVRSATAEAHFTEIRLSGLYRLPVGRTLAKIKDHLRDIHRVFKRDEVMTLRFNGEELVYEEPEFLEAPYYRDANGPVVSWRTEINFDFGEGLSVHGIAAIRRVASTSRAGFALFRRRRLIQGSGDEGYRPESIFGKPNSFAYQRVFGELHLEGFEVSHTKDGFKWNENEDPFLELLKEHLSSAGLPLLQQARNYRVRPPRDELRVSAEQANERASSAIQEHVPAVLADIREDGSSAPTPPRLAAASTASRRTIDVCLGGQPWRIVVELTDDPAVGDWLEISDAVLEGETPPEHGRAVGLRLSLVHPFMEQFAGSDPDQIEPLLRVAAALGLGEVAARDSGVRLAGVIRKNVNELLRNALWQR